MNLENLCREYTAPSDVEFLNDTKILLLVGIMGAGKDTIQSRLLNNSDFHRIITHTTRPPRENSGITEQDGREYHFVSFDQMSELLQAHQLIEVNKFGQHYYGTSIAEFRKAHDANKIALGDIDINGIAAFRAIAEQSIRAIFIVPPDYNSWHMRLSSRFSSSEELARALPERCAIAIDELEHALEVPFFHFLINDSLERAVGAADDIAHRPDIFVRQDDEARLRARDLLDAIKSSL